MHGVRCRCFDTRPEPAHRYMLRRGWLTGPHMFTRGCCRALGLLTVAMAYRAARIC
jgi:hypothetical protein